LPIGRDPQIRNETIAHDLASDSNYEWTNERLCECNRTIAHDQEQQVFKSGCAETSANKARRHRPVIGAGHVCGKTLTLPRRSHHQIAGASKLRV
jgi:hypothetical protein